MQLVEINEPNVPTKSDREIVVGIDFGTTNSLIAFAINNEVKILPDHLGRELIPSAIAYINNQLVIGDLAITGNYLIYSIKRLLGKSFKEIIRILRDSTLQDLVIDNNTKGQINFNGKIYSLPELAAEIFKYLKNQAEDVLGLPLSKAIVTVPAYFDDAAKGEVMLAAKIAGFDVLRLIAEPTAAAYAYGLHKNATGCYLVYDFGGGTFDISVLNMQTGILQVIAVGGDNMLGGVDIDKIIADHLSTKYKIDYSNELLQFAKQMKEELSNIDNSSIEFDGRLMSLSKADFDQLVIPIINKTIKIAKEVLINADNPTLDGIILVGGSTRIPLITKTLKSNFNTVILSDIDPDKAVVHGAALQAQNMTNPYGTVLVDVAALSLGIELYGGIVEKIILRNTPIPISATKEFTTYLDNQTAMQFHVVQGEREIVTDCRSLARFELKNLPPKKAGFIKVEVVFSVDANGILSVSATENTTARSHNIEVNPSYGLTEEEINQVLHTAYQNARADHNNKLLQEAILEAKSLIYNLENALKETGKIINKKDTKQAKKALIELENSIDMANLDNIVEHTKNLKNIAQHIATLRLNYAIASLLEGKHIDDIK